MKIKANPYLFGIMAIAAWSTVATAFKISFRYLSVVEVLCYSIIFSFSTILISAFILGKFKAIKIQSKQQWINSAGLGLLNPVIYYFVLFSAYDSIPAQEAMIINYTWPIFFSITSAIIGKIKISKSQIISLFISFLGLVVIATKGNIYTFSLTNALGDFLALLSALLWTSFWLINLKDTRDPVVKLFSIFLFGAIYSIIILILSSSALRININGLIASAYIGIFEMGLTFILWLTAISLSDRPHKISQLVYLTPFLSLMVIGIALKEEIQISSIIGLILIILGISIQQKSK